MKKLKWYTMNEGKKTDRREKLMRKMANKLYRFSKKYGFSYTEVYYISSDGTATLNIRAKNDVSVEVNSYAFVK